MDLSQLLREYENQSILWKPTHKLYYDKINKEEAWCEISRIFNRNVEQIQKKWKPEKILQ